MQYLDIGHRHEQKEENICDFKNNMFHLFP